MYRAVNLLHITFISFLIVLSSCAPSRIVKPLDAKQKAVGATFGGSLIGFGGAIIPIPFTTVYGAYGIDSALTAFASVHSTSLAFGNFQTDFGVTKQIMKQRGYFPAISITPCINYIVNFNSTKFNFFPQLDVNAYWNNKNGKGYYYVGIDNWMDFSNEKMYGYRYQQTLLFSPQVGYTFEKKKWNFTMELKLMAPNIDNRFSVVDYKSVIGSKGATGLFFGVLRKF